MGLFFFFIDLFLLLISVIALIFLSGVIPCGKPKLFLSLGCGPAWGSSNPWLESTFEKPVDSVGVFPSQKIHPGSFPVYFFCCSVCTLRWFFFFGFCNVSGVTPGFPAMPLILPPPPRCIPFIFPVFWCAVSLLTRPLL